MLWASKMLRIFPIKGFFCTQPIGTKILSLNLRTSTLILGTWNTFNRNFVQQKTITPILMNKKIVAFTVPVVALAACAAVYLGKQPQGFTVNHRTELATEQESEAEIAGGADYNKMLRADLTTGKIDFDAIANVREQVAKVTASRAKMGSWLTWSEMGPDNIGGRTRGLIIDRDNNNIVYAGGVSGGFWKSTNGGGTWKRTGG